MECELLVQLRRDLKCALSQRDEAYVRRDEALDDTLTAIKERMAADTQVALLKEKIEHLENCLKVSHDSNHKLALEKKALDNDFLDKCNVLDEVRKVRDDLRMDIKTGYQRIKEKDQEILALRHGPEGIWVLKGEVMKLEEELKDLVTAGDALAFIVLRDLVKK